MGPLCKLPTHSTASEPFPLDSVGHVVTHNEVYCRPSRAGPWGRGGRWSLTLLSAWPVRTAQAYHRQLCNRWGAATLQHVASCPTQLLQRAAADRELLYREMVEQHYWDMGPWKAKVSSLGQSLGEWLGARQQKACSETTLHPGDIKSSKTV